MLIDHKRRLVFVHVPKTGGTSIVSAIRKADPSIAYSGKMDLLLHAGMNNPNIFEYDSFCVVRNPYDRFISGFKYVKEKILSGDPEFEELNHFVLSDSLDDINKFVKFLENYPHSILGYAPPSCFAQQTFWMAISNKVAVKQFYRFEQIDECLEILGKYYGTTSLPKENVGPVDDSVVLNEESKTLLRQWYWLDFILLGYNK